MATTILAPRNTDVQAYYRFAATAEALTQIDEAAFELALARERRSHPHAHLNLTAQFFISRYARKFAAYLGGAKPKPKPRPDNTHYVSDALARQIEKMVRDTLDHQIDRMRAAVDAQSARA